MSSETDKIVDFVLDSYDFEKVSDLTKGEFSEILSKIFDSSLVNGNLTRRVSKSRHHHSHRHKH